MFFATLLVDPFFSFLWGNRPLDWVPQIHVLLHMAFGMCLGVYTSSLSLWYVARLQPCRFFFSFLNVLPLSSEPRLSYCFCIPCSSFTLSHPWPITKASAHLQELAPMRLCQAVLSLLRDIISCTLALLLYNYLKLELTACCSLLCPVD